MSKRINILIDEDTGKVLGKIPAGPTAEPSKAHYGHGGRAESARSAWNAISSIGASGRLRTARRLGLASAVLLAGCAWQNSLVAVDRGIPETPGEFTPCSLDQVQMRKQLSRSPAIVGIAVPFVIRGLTRGDADHVLRSGQRISLASGAAGAGAPAVLTGLLEVVDAAGGRVTRGTALLDGSTVRIRLSRGGYLSFPSGASSTVAGIDAASLLVMVKADVPDQTRPATCDNRVRDGDFIFARTVSPSAWIGLGAGAEDAGPALAIHPARTSDSRRCVRDEEICRSNRGAPVCVWAPVCAGAE